MAETQPKRRVPRSPVAGVRSREHRHQIVSVTDQRFEFLPTCRMLVRLLRASQVVLGLSLLRLHLRRPLGDHVRSSSRFQCRAVAGEPLFAVHEGAPAALDLDRCGVVAVRRRQSGARSVEVGRVEQTAQPGVQARQDRVLTDVHRPWMRNSVRYCVLVRIATAVVRSATGRVQKLV